LEVRESVNLTLKVAAAISVLPSIVPRSKPTSAHDSRSRRPYATTPENR
jgi:hypothetical protein